MSNSEQYDVNFFKPLSDHAKANKKLIVTLATIWAVGVFGFQFLLIIFNEPTPEKSYLTFESVYPAVIEENGVTTEMKTDFAKSVLYVLGKNIAVKDDHKEILKKSFSWAVASIQPDSMKSVYFNEQNEELLNLATQSLGLQTTGFDKIMIDLIPNSLIKIPNAKFPEECKADLPGIMELYLVHNQSFLTDFNFLGFPFHYWYTGQFLLILFVILCVVYAKAIDKANVKHNFIEET